MKFLVSWLGLDPYVHLSDYMHRWWLVRAADDKSRKAARLHRILRSDHDRALHDHPWDNCSVVLRGGYWEVQPGSYQRWFETDLAAAPAELRRLHEQIQVRPGRLVPAADHRALARHGVLWRGPLSRTKRRAEALHRLVVPRGRECWTIFITWPKTREWGFQTADGWVHNVDYLSALGRDA